MNFATAVLSVYLLATAILLVGCAPTGNTGNTGIDKNAAKSYLRKFGHIDRDNDSSVTDDDLNEGLASFQAFTGLPVTGQLDNATKAHMVKPRCGHPDKIKGQVNSHRDRRYALSGASWSTPVLTYFLIKGPTKSLTMAQAAVIVARAYRFWTDVACLTISPVSTLAAGNMSLLFRAYSHGDGASFDGPGQVLAHAFYPPYGWIHFDDSEIWTNASTAGINLLQLAVHEIGHALGLYHSDVLLAAMYPYYFAYQPQFALDADDIAGIQALYGFCPTSTTAKPTTTTPTTTTKTTTTTTKPSTKPTTAMSTTSAKPLYCVYA